MSLDALPKESAPEIQIPIAIVSSSLSGATAKEVEEQITNEIEKAVEKITGVDTITSTSSDGRSTTIVNFNQNEDIDKKVSEVKSEVDKIRSKLPSDASDPTVSDVNFSDQPVFSFTIASNENKFQLQKIANLLQEEIESITGTSEVSYTGLPEYEVSVFLDPKKIQSQNLSFGEIANAIRSANILSPLGDIKIAGQNYNLSLDTQIKKSEQLENIPITKKGRNIIYLKDIAYITEGFAKEKVTSEILFPKSENSSRALVFSVSKNTGYNIVTLTENINKKLEELSKTGGIINGIPYRVTQDSGADAKKDMVNLSQNGLAAVILVFIILFFVLGVKDSFIAAVGIPISFLVAFIFFNLVGNTLNFISLFSMILSIGILVDSDIVITEGIAKKKENLRKENPGLRGEELEKQASETAIKELAGPMIAGTATTIAVFAPLFFLSGVTGQFISGIPFTIVFILLASQIVSVFIIPLFHGSKFRFPFANFWKKLFTKIGWRSKKEEGEKSEKKKAMISFEKWEEKYKNILHYFFKRKYRENILIILVILTFFVTLSLPISGILKAKFFPGGDVPFIYGNVELDKGSNQQQTADFISIVEQMVKEEPFYDSIIITKGQTSQYANDISRGDRFGNILINIKEEFKSEGTAALTKLREITKENNWKYIEFSAPEGGPPTGSPIEFDIISDSFELSKNGAILAENILRTDSSVINISTDLDKNNTGFELQVNREKALLYNVSISTVAQEIFASTNGVESIELKNESDSTQVYLKMQRNEQNQELQELSPETISGIRVKNNVGKYVSVSSFTTIIPKSVNSTIKHLDGKVSVKITAENVADSSLGEIISRFKKNFSEKNTSEARIEFGGTFAEQEQSFGETGAAFLGGVALIFGILIFLFNSIRLPMIIESVIPLAFSGVIVGLTITGNALSFPAILGFIALSGIVVNNSIILIYVYEKLRKEKLKTIETKENKKRTILLKDEISEVVETGSASRLRPIILTTITTIVGVVPLLFASAIWAPIAYSIIFGLLFATIITLIFIPIIYKKFYPKK